METLLNIGPALRALAEMPMTTRLRFVLNALLIGLITVLSWVLIAVVF